jgi:protein-arginine kinase activator protein McsA
MEIGRFYIDFNKYAIMLYNGNLNCDLCLENKASFYFWKIQDNILFHYYLCRFCLKAKIIELFNNLIKGYFNSIRLITNRHYLIIKRIRHNSHCDFCKNNIEFELSRYKMKYYYICSECLKEELIKVKDYLMVIISVKK